MINNVVIVSGVNKETQSYINMYEFSPKIPSLQAAT